MVAREAPAIRIYTDVERAASLKETLDARPDGDIWLFAYGSLIWNPTITPADCKVARVQGWHRSFCLSIVAGRGSAQFPGLVLGLDVGGDCLGVAYKMHPDLMEKELELLWRREMLTSGYVPRWVDIFNTEGSPMGKALTFTIDPTAISYAGMLSRDETIARLATAPDTWDLRRNTCSLLATGCSTSESRTAGSRIWQWPWRGLSRSES